MKPILKKQTKPFTIKIELTEGCNLYCKFCAIRAIRKGPGNYKFMTLKTALLIAKSIKKNGWTNIRFEFAMHGEPLMNPNHNRILKIFRRILPKSSIMVTSNGGPLLKMAKKNFYSLMDIVNILALDDYEHSGFIKKLKRKYKEFSFIDYPQMTPYKRYKPNEHYIIAMPDISKHKKKTRILHNTAGLSAPKDFSIIHTRCYRPFRECSFNYNGDLLLCCNDFKNDFKIGNIRDKDIQELWNNKKIQSARKILYHKGRFFSICYGCNAPSFKNGLLPDHMGKYTLEKVTSHDKENVGGFKKIGENMKGKTNNKILNKNEVVLILTRGRANRQITLDNLHPKLYKNTYLVVEESEINEHINEKVEVLSFPKKTGNFIIDGSGNFSDKKEWCSKWCIKNGYRYVLLLDDDLKFDIRRDGKLKPAKKKESLQGIKLLFKWLEAGYAHVAMSPREGNNRIMENHIEVGRAMRVCGFDLKIIKKHNLKFNRTVLMADFDITLQLLELGYPNKISYKYANSQRRSNDDGGCSLYRTPNKMKEAANSLYKLHPLSVRIKETKTSKPWAGFKTNKRTDVQVSWKKTYKIAQKRKKSRLGNFL